MILDHLVAEDALAERFEALDGFGLLLFGWASTTRFFKAATSEWLSAFVVLSVFQSVG